MTRSKGDAQTRLPGLIDAAASGSDVGLTYATIELLAIAKKADKWSAHIAAERKAFNEALANPVRLEGAE
jgi:antitoxin (DNA-binding transcriptional repressor) of toxin-antitoxin stability system